MNKINQCLSHPKSNTDSTRMNKWMQNKIGERVTDEVSRNWALSHVMLRNWSAKTNEIETEM